LPKEQTYQGAPVGLLSEWGPRDILSQKADEMRFIVAAKGNSQTSFGFSLLTNLSVLLTLPFNFKLFKSIGKLSSFRTITKTPLGLETKGIEVKTPVISRVGKGTSLPIGKVTGVVQK